MFFKSVFFNFSSIFFQLIQQIRKIYLNSPIYNKKISKFDDKVIIYKPSQSILNCLIKFDKALKILIFSNLRSTEKFLPILPPASMLFELRV